MKTTIAAVHLLGFINITGIFAVGVFCFAMIKRPPMIKLYHRRPYDFEWKFVYRDFSCPNRHKNSAVILFPRLFLPDNTAAIHCVFLTSLPSHRQYH